MYTYICIYYLCINMHASIISFPQEPTRGTVSSPRDPESSKPETPNPKPETRNRLADLTPDAQAET